LILATTENITGYRISQVFGLVQGSSVRARHVGSDITAFLRI